MKINYMNPVSVAWFEIPTSDFDRACQFYENIFSISIQRMDLGVLQMGLLSEQAGSGALVHHPEFYFPSEKGPLLHLEQGEDLSVVLDKVEGAGGKVIIPKRQISEERGFMAVFMDTEGNRVALHSVK